MNAVEKAVQSVAWRLTVQRTLETLVWFWTASAFLAAAVVATGKLAGWPLSRVLAASGVLAIAATALGVLVAWLRRVHRLRAAAEIDRAFHLEDRVTSAISLPKDLRAEPAAQALLADVEQHLSHCEVTRQFALRVPRALLAPLAPLLLATACWLLLPSWQRESRAVDRSDAASEAAVERRELAERVQRAMQRLQQELALMAPQVPENQPELAELRQLLGDLERLAYDTNRDAARSEPEKTLERLTEIEQRLQEQQRKLAQAAQVRNSLQDLARRVRAAEQAPLERFRQALAQGKLDQAAKALRELAKELEKSDLPPEQQQALKNQLQQLQQELEKLRSLKEARERLARSGLKGKQLQRALKALQKQLGDPGRLQRLARNLAQAAQAAGQGDKAAEALAQQLQQLAAQFEQLAQDAAAQRLAQDLLDAIADLRQHLGCQRCKGAG